jgi:hypothetical protein
MSTFFCDRVVDFIFISSFIKSNSMLQCALKPDLRPVYTMDHEGGLPWSNSLKTQFTKALGPSLGVNQMWTKRNGHAPRSECVDFLNICPKKADKKNKFDHSLSFLVFIFSSPKKHFIKKLL